MAFTPITVKAVEGVANVDPERIKLYTAEVPATTVADFYVEPAANMAGGFQRILDSDRAAKIGKLMGGDKLRKIDPTPNVHGGLLAYGDMGDITYNSTTGMLIINNPLRLVDGQHRAGGARWARDNGKNSSYTETVRVVVGATKAELAMWYLRTNIEARKVAPANIILNVAAMQGVVLRRKSWVARIVVALTQQEPLLVGEKRLVSFTPKDNGKIAAQTLYRCIDVLLPPPLNQEGPESEAKAAMFAWNAIDIYSRLVGQDWGLTDDDGLFLDNEAYSFTLMVAYGRLYSAVWDDAKKIEEIEQILRDSFPIDEIPDVGSGEKAAVSLASYAAGRAGVSLGKMASAAA